jgi:hypothetical protein
VKTTILKWAKGIGYMPPQIVSGKCRYNWGFEEISNPILIYRKLYKPDSLLIIGGNNTAGVGSLGIEFLR